MTAASWPDGSDVAEDSLRLGEELGKGGQGRVLRAATRSAVPLVFKQYIVPGADPAALQELVDLPSSLSPPERYRLLAQTAWPLARVMRRGALRGFLMRAIPSEFIGSNSAGDPKLRELQYLLYEPKPMWGGIVPPEIGTAVRLAVATEFTRLMHLLHGKSLVLGDVSMRNILWVPDDPARIFVIDCDGVRKLGGRPVLPQAETPDWNDPQKPAVGPDLDTDRYKLALLVGRVLARKPYIRPDGRELNLVPGLPGELVTRVTALWKQAADPRGTRPDAAQWLMALDGHSEIALPEIHQAAAYLQVGSEGTEGRPVIKLPPIGPAS
jgi:DNA-binding helix-hairpin-helix protein with protein kinase domain